MNYKKILKKINKLEPKMSEMSDDELQAQTSIIREKITSGVREKKIIAYAFAVMREVDKRLLGLFPNDEQVMGAITIYFGDIAEMKTGEGKTLVATLPLFLKAIQMPGVFLVTTNEYLAHRDFEKMAKVYEWMGLTVSDGTVDVKNDFEAKKEIYESNIVYTSNYILGFDFLIDGLAEDNSHKYIKEFNFAILDEVDAILLDSAQTPLLISGAPKVQSNYFHLSNNFILSLEKNVDYEFDEERKSVWLTEVGINNAKKYFDINNLLDVDFFELYRHLILALKANFILKKNKDYVVVDNEVKLLDHKNGRIMEGTRLQSGLQQAIESKENVDLTIESQTISSITFQNLFRRFKSLSGMTGTAKTSENEFVTTYNMAVKKIKTHKPNKRKDHRPEYYVTFDAKVDASMKKILELHKTGRPILIVTETVDVSELYSMYLLNMGIPHTVLNAKNNAKEAMIIKEAGNKNSITVATVMAGRGTDIVVDDASIKLGGLAVVLTETMNSQRDELQAQGRSGRQGLPGDTYSYQSLEDDVIKSNVQGIIQKYYDKHKNKKNKRIHNIFIKKAFQIAQQKSEDSSEGSRSSNLQFDEISRLQKEVIDKSRDKIMNMNDINMMKRFIIGNLKIAINDYFKDMKTINHEQFKRFILDNVDYNFKEDNYKNEFTALSENLSISDVVNLSTTIFKKSIDQKQESINDSQAFLQYLKITSLKAIDLNWSEQVDSMNQLRQVVQSRASAQRNPALEYEAEVKKSYYYYRVKTASMIFRYAALSMTRIVKGELVVIFP